MTQITVATWNTQGNPQNAANKMAMLEDLLKRVDFVCIQEAGQLALQNPNRDVWRLGNYYIVGVDHAGAFNQRCATAVMSKHELILERPISIPGTLNTIENPLYLQSGSGRFCPLVTAKVQNSRVIIGSAHAEASHSAGLDLGTVLDKIASREIPIIVGGDWNTEPNSLIRRYPRNIAFSGQPTHPSKSPRRQDTELDYFCFSSSCTSVRTYLFPQQALLSDHYAVIGEFNI